MRRPVRRLPSLRVLVSRGNGSGKSTLLRPERDGLLPEALTVNAFNHGPGRRCGVAERAAPLALPLSRCAS